jgi:hypothetical protein
VDRGFVHGRISDADPVLVARAVQVGIRYPSPLWPFRGQVSAPESGRSFGLPIGTSSANLDEPGQVIEVHCHWPVPIQIHYRASQNCLHARSTQRRLGMIDISKSGTFKRHSILRKQ